MNKSTSVKSNKSLEKSLSVCTSIQYRSRHPILLQSLFVDFSGYYIAVCGRVLSKILLSSLYLGIEYNLHITKDELVIYGYVRIEKFQEELSMNAQ